MQLREGVHLAGFTTLGVGGPAAWFLEAPTEVEVREGLDWARSREIPVFVLGGGSNLLVSDAGYPGLVLQPAIHGVVALPGGDGLLEAGAAEPWDELVALAVARGLQGLECLSGIPGSVGGTPIQNVGAYGQEAGEVITSVQVLERSSGGTRRLSREECGFSYRTSRFNSVDRDRFVVLRVSFALRPGGGPRLDYRDLKLELQSLPTPGLPEVRAAVLAIRKRKGMVLDPSDPDTRSAGSFFKNPVLDADALAALSQSAGAAPPQFPASDGQVKVAAAWMIEQAGFLRGHRRGNAAISSKHTLALTNRGGASARELRELAREIRDGVAARFGVSLEPEPVMLGFPDPF